MEKLYHKINAIGISNLVIGIVTILVGVGAGVTMIVNGARLITGKKDITFETDCPLTVKEGSNRL